MACMHGPTLPHITDLSCSVTRPPCSYRREGRPDRPPGSPSSRACSPPRPPSPPARSRPASRPSPRHDHRDTAAPWWRQRKPATPTTWPSWAPVLPRRLSRRADAAWVPNYGTWTEEWAALDARYAARGMLGLLDRGVDARWSDTECFFGEDAEGRVRSEPEGSSRRRLGR